MTGVYLGLFGGVTLWAALAKRDFFSPVRLYVMAYSFFLTINSLMLSRLQTEWSATTKLLFWGASGLFVGAGVLVLLLDKVKGGKEMDFTAFRAGLKRDAEGLDWDWYFRVFRFCTAVYLLSYLGATLLYGTIPILADHPDKARVDFFTVSLPTSIGLFFGPLSMMLGTEAILFGPYPRRTKWWIGAFMGLVFFLYLTIAMRLDLFRYFVFALLLYHYGRRQLGLKQFVMAAGAGIAVFVVIYLVRVHGDAINQLNEIAKVRMPPKYIWASQIYAYVVSNFWNMDYGFTRYVDELGHYPLSWGFELFRPVMFLLQAEVGMQKAYGFDSIYNDSVNFVQGMNSTVYLWHFFKDFGAFGVYFLTFSFGLALAFFYRNMGKDPTLFRVSLWALFAGIIIFSITAALWEFWFTYLNIAVLAVAHRRLRLL